MDFFKEFEDYSNYTPEMIKRALEELDNDLYLKKKDNDDLLANMEDVWDFLYIYQLQKYVAAKKFKDKGVIQIVISKIISDFKTKVQNSVVDFVNDLLSDNFNQSPKILEVERDTATSNIKSLEVINDDLLLKLYFPRAKKFEYFDHQNNEIKDVMIVDSDYFKMLKQEFTALQKIFEVLIEIQEEDKDFIFAVPLSALVDYKGLRIRVTTLTHQKDGRLVWGFDQNSNRITNFNVKKKYLEKLGDKLLIKRKTQFQIIPLFPEEDLNKGEKENLDMKEKETDSIMKRERESSYDFMLSPRKIPNEDSEKMSPLLPKNMSPTKNFSLDAFGLDTDLKSSPRARGAKNPLSRPVPSIPYECSISPVLTIYKNRYRNLENFQNKHLKSQKNVIKPKEIPMYYISRVGPLSPPDCNFFYNPGLKLTENIRLIEKNQYKCDYLKMTESMTAYQKYLFRLGSQVKGTKIFRPEFMEEIKVKGIKIWGQGYIGNPKEAELTIQQKFTRENTDESNQSFSSNVENIEETTLEDDKFNPHYLGYLDQFLNFRRFELNVQDYCDSNLPTEREMIKLTNLSKKLYYENIPKLIYYLESKAIFPFSSKILKDAFFKFGVNLRHIGIVAYNTQIPEIRALCIEEMIARTFKKVFYFTFSEKFFQVRRVDEKIGKYAADGFEKEGKNKEQGGTSKVLRGLNKADSTYSIGKDSNQLTYGGDNFLKRESSARTSKDARLSIKIDEPQKNHLTDFLESVLRMKGEARESRQMFWDNL